MTKPPLVGAITKNPKTGLWRATVRRGGVRVYKRGGSAVGGQRMSVGHLPTYEAARAALEGLYAILGEERIRRSTQARQAGLKTRIKDQK